MFIATCIKCKNGSPVVHAGDMKLGALANYPLSGNRAAQYVKVSPPPSRANAPHHRCRGFPSTVWALPGCGTLKVRTVLRMARALGFPVPSRRRLAGRDYSERAQFHRRRKRRANHFCARCMWLETSMINVSSHMQKVQEWFAHRSRRRYETGRARYLPPPGTGLPHV